MAALSAVRYAEASSPFVNSSRMWLAEAKPFAAPPLCPTTFRNIASGAMVLPLCSSALQYSTPRISFGSRSTAASSPMSALAALSLAAAKDRPLASSSRRARQPRRAHARVQWQNRPAGQNRRSSRTRPRTLPRLPDGAIHQFATCGRGGRDYIRILYQIPSWKSSQSGYKRVTFC